MASRGRWKIPVLAAFFLGWSLIMAFAAQDALAFFGQFAFGELLRQLLSGVLAYLILLVFVGDLILGHTMNTGQMSSDTAYLNTLPLPPAAFLCMKLVERTITDWGGFLLLFSSLIGAACHSGINWTGVGMATLVYLEVSLLIGLSVTLAGIVLQRFFRPALVNNLLAQLGFVSGFAALLPFLWLSSAPATAMGTIITLHTRFTPALSLISAPLCWLVDLLLDGFAATTSFLYWHLFWGSGMALGLVGFLLMMRWRWPFFIHTSRRLRVVHQQNRISGVCRKEFLLLKSDYNILTNALLLPLSFIFIEVYLFHDMVNLDTVPRVVLSVGLAATYFHLFGPMNAVGSEGKAITVLETLPISPERFLLHKCMFWGVLACIFFLPAAAGVAYYSQLSLLDSLHVIAWTAFLCVWFNVITVSLSAIFAVFDSKVLQQRSTMSGKIAAALVMGLALSIQEFDGTGLVTLLLFVLLALALFRKAGEVLRTRLDQGSLFSPCFKLPDALLLLLVVFGIQHSFSGTLAAILGSVLPHFLLMIVGYWISIVVLLRSTVAYAGNRFPNRWHSLGLRGCHAGYLVFALALSVLLIWGFAKYIVWMEHSGYQVYTFPQIFLAFLSQLVGQNWSWGLALVLGCGVAPLTEELFFRGFVEQALRRTACPAIVTLVLGAVLFALFHPANLFVCYFCLGISTILLFRRSGSLWPSICLNLAFHTGITVFFGV